MREGYESDIFLIVTQLSFSGSLRSGLHLRLDSDAYGFPYVSLLVAERDWRALEVAR